MLVSHADVNVIMRALAALARVEPAIVRAEGSTCRPFARGSLASKARLMRVSRRVGVGMIYTAGSIGVVMDVASMGMVIVAMAVRMGMVMDISVV